MFTTIYDALYNSGETSKTAMEKFCQGVLSPADRLHGRRRPSVELYFPPKGGLSLDEQLFSPHDEF